MNTRRRPAVAPTYGGLIRKFRWALLISAVLWTVALFAITAACDVIAARGGP